MFNLNLKYSKSLNECWFDLFQVPFVITNYISQTFFFLWHYNPVSFQPRYGRDVRFDPYCVRLVKLVLFKITTHLLGEKNDLKKSPTFLSYKVALTHSGSRSTNPAVRWPWQSQIGKVGVDKVSFVHEISCGVLDGRGRKHIKFPNRMTRHSKLKANCIIYPRMK